MMEGAEGAHTYGATRGSNEDSKLMATAMAGTAFQAAKREASKLKAKVLSLRDGPVSMNILSYIGGVSLVLAGSLTFLGNFFTLKIISAVVNLYLIIFGLVIVLIEARHSIFPPIALEYIREYFAFITLVWGRGGFFIFVGTLALAQWDFVDIVLGIYLIGLGAGMIYWGMGAANALDALVHEMKDPEHVEEVFNKFDYDGNGHLETNELADLLKSLGAEMRPKEVEAASLMMDRDHNGKISLHDFKNWWIRTDIVDAVIYN